MIEHQHGKYLHRRNDALIAHVRRIKEQRFEDQAAQSVRPKRTA